MSDDDFARRSRWQIRTHARRLVASPHLDPEALALLHGLSVELEEATALVVGELRRRGWNWAEIARPIGLTRHGARKKWGLDERHD